MKEVSLYDTVVLYFFYRNYFQSMYTKYYSSNMPKVYEWEPYLGYNPHAIIYHWHGPKYFLKDDTGVCPANGEFQWEQLRQSDPYSLLDLMNTEMPMSAEAAKKYHEVISESPVLAKSGYKHATSLFVSYLYAVCKSNAR